MHTLELFVENDEPCDLSALGAGGNSGQAHRTQLEETLLYNLSDRLVSKGPDGENEHALLASHTVSADGLTWRFQLREGRRFHNGEEITAEDVIASLELALTSAALQGGLLAMLLVPATLRDRGSRRRFHRISRYRFEVALRKPTADLVDCLALTDAPILHSGSLKRGLHVYSGLYQLLEKPSTAHVHDSGVLLELSLNKAHPESAPSLFETILVRKRDAQTTLADALRSEPSLALVSGLSSSSGQLPGTAKIYGFGGPTGHTACLFLNVAHELFPAIKAALFESVRSRYVNDVFPYLELATSFFPQKHCLHMPVERTPHVFPNRDVHLVVGLKKGVWPSELLRRIAEKAATLRVFLNFTAIDEEPTFENLEGQEFDAILRAWPASETDPLAATHIWSERNLRVIGEGTGELFSLLKAARSRCEDRGTRIQNLRHFCRGLLTKTRTIALFQIPQLVVLSESAVQGAATNSLGRLNFASLRHKPQSIDEEALRRTKLEAIMATTQMFAHDVRKPFSMLKVILEMLQSTQCLADMHDITQRMLPEVDKAMNSVNVMIQDIMDIGSHRVAHKESCSVASLIEGSLNDVFRLYPNSRVAFAYELSHSGLVNVDTLRIPRLFSNIITNALQAMRLNGRMWFKSRDIVTQGGNFVELCIGNSDSHISCDEQSRIFEAFYTKGKRGGTGLGLAIAQKIVASHGGTIWCKSSPEVGVEFFFTLPSAICEASQAFVTLPVESQEITLMHLSHQAGFALHAQQESTSTAWQNDTRAEDNNASRNYVDRGAPRETGASHEEALERSILALTQLRQNAVRLLIVDDEPVYRDTLRSHIERSHELALAVTVLAAASGQEALQLAQGTSFDACICDIDLGCENFDGFDVVRALRARGMPGVVCIHSNKTLQDRTALEAGADSFLPKPMSRFHLLTLIKDALERERGSHAIAELESPLQAQKKSAHTEPGNTPEVAIVDDNFVVLHGWTRKLVGVKTHVFRSPAAFWKALESDPSFGNRLQCVVTDQCFGEEDASTDGMTFARALAKSLGCPVVVCSNADLAHAEWSPYARALIGKDPLNWAELKRTARIREP